MNPEPHSQANRNSQTGGRRIAIGITLLVCAALLSAVKLTQIDGGTSTDGAPAAATATELHRRGPESSEQVLVRLHASSPDATDSTSEVP